MYHIFFIHSSVDGHLGCFHALAIFFLFFILYLCEMMDVSWTYCSNHSTIYVNQIIMLCVLNWYSDICRLFLSETGNFFNINQIKNNKKFSEMMLREFFFWMSIFLLLYCKVTCDCVSLGTLFFWNRVNVL